MKRAFGLIGLVGLGFVVGCTPAKVEEGGANANDRTWGGEQGEALLTGAMQVSPSGHFVVMQRNTITVLLDVEKGTTTELPQLSRIALAKAADVGYELLPDGALVALDLATATELWRDAGPYSDVSQLKLTDDEKRLVVADGAVVHVIDPASGETSLSVPLSGSVTFASSVPGADRMVFVGSTSWKDHAPLTDVSLVDLGSGELSVASVPNCEAPVSILPDASRLLMSPTFCEEDEAADPNDEWTNPDPVSVVDMTDAGLTFVKNLPGFGPVALSPDGSRAVAYLDEKRVEAKMFDDAAQVPKSSGPRYSLMVIDPHTLKFSVTAVGDGLPRFALTRDGNGLLVDSSVKVVERSTAKADASIDIGPSGFSGQVSVHASVFGEETPFGYFDLATLAFTGFAGSHAGLDRFVQLADAKTVITLEKRADGLGGMPFLIDLEAKTTSALTGDYGTGVRDVGLLPDGQTVLLRFREAAAQIGNDLFAREAYCLSLDGLTCATGRVEYQASVSFATADTNDCANMGHDCW